MNRFKLKVCGLTQLQQIVEITQWKVDFIGFIFYPSSPRYILNHLSLDELAAVEFSNKVGVFVNEDLHYLLDCVKKAKLNIIQLHGQESADYIREIKEQLPFHIIIKSISMHAGMKLHYDLDVDYYLLDTKTPQFGGSGNHFNWKLIDDLNLNRPYILSGGITTNDLSEIFKIERQPYAIDINSKFEISAGIKDLEKIKTFINKINT